MNKAPDTIFYNGKIYTVDKNRSVVSALAVEGDTIAAVGSDDEIKALAGAETKIVNLKGQLMIPGLNDSHAHPFFLATMLDDVSFLSAKCIQDCLDLLAERAKVTPEGDWIQVQMAWHETQLKECRFPTRKEIDSVCPNHPVSIRRGGHIKVINTKAMELAGISEEPGPDPAGGRFGRDADGKFDGFLLDDAGKPLEAVLPKPIGPKFVEGLSKVGSMLNSYGVTTTSEMGTLVPILPVQENNFRTISKLYEEGKMPVRVAAMVFAFDEKMANWAVNFGRSFPKTDMFKFQGLKLIQDGGIEGAHLKDPYMVIEGAQPDPEFRGVAIWGKDREQEFCNVMQICAENGLMLQVHANGDQSAEDIVNLLARQGEKSDIGKLNWTICHLPLASDDVLDKIKKYDICVSIQHQPYLLGINARRYWGVERADSQANYRKLFDMGIRLGGGTDYPIGPYNPFPCIQFMVDRKIIDGSVMGPDYALTLDEAIYVWTQGSADIEGWGDMIGSIEPGKKADLAVLSQDIFTIPVDDIHNTYAVQTWVGGKLVYEK